MKSIIPVILVASIAAPAFGFHVINQTKGCIYIKEYAHIFNRYNEHILSGQLGTCDPTLTRCTGQLDIRVIKHSDGSDIQMEEPICTWAGDVGNGTGTFTVTPITGITPGEEGSCKLQYHK